MTTRAMCGGDTPDGMRWIEHLEAFAEGVDSWVVDQYGVFVDDRGPFAPAVQALRRLVARGDPVIVLSNSGKRAAANAARLARRGIDRGAYSALMTSGEMAHRLLAERADPFFAGLGRRCWLLANDGDRGIVEGLAIDLVDDVREADFLLIGGPNGASHERAFDDVFAAAIARGRPAVCANPDFLRFHRGTMAPAGGALARRYEMLGGTVRWIGKPHPEVYAWCAAELAARGCRCTVMIGDSLVHDIAGAQRAGWRTLFVADGVHRAELDEAAPRDELLRRVAAGHGLLAPPDAVIPRLAW